MACLKEGMGATEFIPLINPKPPELSRLAEDLASIENSQIFSNFGPKNTEFEHALVREHFDGVGRATTVCNATIGLMVALARGGRISGGERRYALMPAFTFAATAQAALWAGMTPLLCDIDPRTWLACPDSEQELLARYGDRVAAIVPCATFGNPIDLDHYHGLAERYGCRLVVDAASGLGTTDLAGRQFGIGSADAVVFSMHATKAFATGEGGVIYSAEDSIVDELRSMDNFGLSNGVVVSLGLNGKLSEVAALLALKKLETFGDVIAHRFARYNDYAEALPEFESQSFLGSRWAPMFVPVLIPSELAPFRELIRTMMKDRGVGTGIYFNPHLARHPYLGPLSEAGSLPVSDEISRRVLALPMSDVLTKAQVLRVASVLREVCEALRAANGLRSPASARELSFAI